MRLKTVLLLVALSGLPALAQEEGSSREFEDQRYGVKVTAPEGWKMTFKGPKAAGRWVDLVRYQEPRTRAELSLSVQATEYRETEAMLEGLRRQFKKDTSLAILRDEARGATSSRPKGAFFEYTYQGKQGTDHAVAAYWLHLGRRYRIFGTVSEKGWRTVSGDMTDFVSSLAFTSRAYSADPRNFTDEPGNYRIYFPETWKIEMPAGGPRAVFRAPRNDVSVYLYLTDSEDSLAENAARALKSLKSDGASVK